MDGLAIAVIFLLGLMLIVCSMDNKRLHRRLGGEDDYSQHLRGRILEMDIRRAEAFRDGETRQRWLDLANADCAKLSRRVTELQDRLNAANEIMVYRDARLVRMAFQLAKAQRELAAATPSSASVTVPLDEPGAIGFRAVGSPP